MDNVKYCPKCLCTKSISDFYINKNKNRKDGLQPYCISCTKQYNKQRWAKQPYSYRRKMGLSSHYSELCIPDSAMELLLQGTFICPICSKEKAPVVDHDHKLNRFRGLVCNECNLLLGLAGDSVVLLRSAAQYMENFYGT